MLTNTRQVSSNPMAPSTAARARVGSDPSQVLRDYVVQVDPDNRDLYLGKAYVAAGPLRIPTSFFIIERFHKGIDEIR